LEQAFQRERTTTANIAHELRTPLSGLKAAIELAESRPRKVEYYQDTLADCRRLTNDLQTLVERTMLLSRLDAGKLGLNPEPVNPSELLPQLWKETVRNLATPSGASLPTAEFRIDPVLSVVVDRSCLIQIVRNLLTNAASHGDPSQPVVIEAQRAENRVEIIVTNHSPGLSQQDLCQLKQRFFQLDQNRARTGRHAGLGLSICDELARQLNGKLTLSLAIGGRFQATMSLPSERPPPTNGELSSPGRSPSMSV
jgi:signal transduction histidine kinase